jgi:tetratricopeptide (TPR) repeat protein
MSLLILAASTSAYQTIAPFWSSTIDSALRNRDLYYKTILPDTSNFSIISLNKIQQSEMCERLNSIRDTSNPWYNFLLGILQCTQGKTASADYFATSITLAQQDPGTTWALFIEFTRNRQSVWAEHCLMNLEKLLLASGARSAPTIAQQLLFYAFLSDKQVNDSSSLSYYRWAERFDRGQPWSSFHRLLKSLPSHPPIFVTSFNEILKLLLGSWMLQLRFAANFYAWIHYIMLFFILTVFTGAGFKYLPQAIHPIADRLPEEIPSSLKTLFPMVMFIAFLSFGLVPFLLLLSFLIWQFIEKKEKIIVGIALFLLLCTPFDARIQDMFRQALMPQGSISLYSRAFEEGYSPEIHQRVSEKIVSDRSDFLAQMAASLCAQKKGDTAAACLNANNALALRPDDPVILLNAGNAAYMANDFKTAALRYQKILSKYPVQMEARFNLAQCYARKSDAAIDLDFIKALTANELGYINEFTNTNDIYFSKNLPAIRQVIPPVYTPSFFWENIFPAYTGSWKTAENLWGASFLGVSPYHSIFVFSVVLLLFIVWNLFRAMQRHKSPHVSCRLCKRMVCKNCKKGELCLSCFYATRFIRNVKTLASIQAKIIYNRQVSQNVIAYLLDICLPGSGMFFAKTHSLLVIFPVILLTSIVFASYFVVSTIHLSYPHWVVYEGLEKASYFLGCYNLIFVVRAVFAALRKKEAVLV